MGWSFNEPGNPGEVFVLLCPFKGAFDAPGFVLGTMMSSINLRRCFLKPPGSCGGLCFCFDVNLQLK